MLQKIQRLRHARSSNAVRILLAGMMIALCTVALSAGPSDREDVDIEFDRHKGKLYAIYTRALKENPGLRGRVDLDITIAKSGDVSDCRVRSSTLGAPEVARALCEKVREMKFAPKPVERRISKLIDFYPSA
jgi:TonB family protein